MTLPESRPRRQSPGARAASLLSSRLAFALLVLVAGLALLLGSFRPAAPTRASRITALEAAIKCPSCADLTIGQSDAAAATDLRAEVVAMVDAGDSDAAIKARVVAQYGSAVLEVPSGGGAGVIVWALPAGLLALLVASLGAFLWQRRRSPPVVVGGPEREREEDEALVAAARAARPT